MHLILGKLFTKSPLASSSIKTIVLTNIRMASSLFKDKAYVNGEWVSASSGATFEGMYQSVYIFSMFYYQTRGLKY